MFACCVVVHVALILLSFLVALSFLPFLRVLSSLFWFCPAAAQRGCFSPQGIAGHD